MTAQSSPATVSGLPPERLIEVVESVIPASATIEALLVAGSLAEGLATPTSDIDLILIYSDPGDTLPDEIALEIDGVLVDVQLRRLDACARMLGAAAAWVHEGEWALAAAPFTDGERTFIHRVLSGIFLIGSPDRLAPGDARAAAQRTLLRLKFETARHHARSLQVDAHGCWLDADHLVAAAMAHAALHHALDALAAALGEANTNPKWRLRHIRRLARQGRLGRDVAEALTGLLMAGVDPADAAACTAFAARATAAVRALLLAGSDVIDSGLPNSLSLNPASLLVDRRFRFDLDAQADGVRGQLRLLAGDGPPLALARDELDAVMRADPDATLVAARSTVAGAAGGLPAGVEDWLSAHGAQCGASA